MTRSFPLFVLLILVACSTSKPAVQPRAVDPATEPTNVGAGGPQSGTADQMKDRLRRTRDTVVATAAVVGATRGAVEGAKRGYQFDKQFAELREIEELDVTRPHVDQIEVRMASAPTRGMLVQIAAVFAGREERMIDVEAAGDAASGVRDALIELGVPPSTLRAHRNEEVAGVVLRIGYRS